jgi:hypothetical protein
MCVYASSLHRSERLAYAANLVKQPARLVHPCAGGYLTPKCCQASWCDAVSVKYSPVRFGAMRRAVGAA